MVDPFDLDAARAARLEARGETRWFIFGGDKFELPAELPAEFAYLLDDPKEALRFLLGDDFDRFWKLRPSGQDLVALVGWLTKEYGAQGESSASGSSSAAGGRRSRPTSPATTKSTSAKRASDRGRSGPAGSSH